MALEESGRAPPPGRGLALRAWPFPFRAALAVNSGSLGLSDAGFEALHAFVNGRGPTPLGDGLGLEMGVGLELAAHDGPGTLRAGSPRLAALDEAGWLDSAHGRGPNGAAAAPRVAGLRGPPRLLVSDAAGPAPPDTEGFAFATTDAWREKMKFGDHMNYRQPTRLADTLAGYDWSQWLAPDLDGPGPAAASVSTIDPRRGMLALFNSVLQPCAAPGGAILFKRFAGAFGSAGTAFAPQASTQRLDVLASLGGGVVVAQDFGFRSLLGRRAPSVPVGEGPPLDVHGRVAWQDIAARAEAGTLLVAATGRLLEWLWRRASLRFRVERAADRWVATLEGFRCTVRGDRAVGEADLDGLAFTLPARAPEVVVRAAGWSAPLPLRRGPDPAQPGAEVLHIPWSRLEWPPA